MEALRATQLLATSRCQMLVQEEALSSIPMYHPVSPSDTITERSQHASSTIELVHNMAMPTALPEQQLHLGQRVFLRRVEQVRAALAIDCWFHRHMNGCKLVSACSMSGARGHCKIKDCLRKSI